MYIQQFFKPSAEQQRNLIQKQNELRTAQQLFSARTNVDIFDINFVCVRDRDDYIPAKFLTKAIEHVFKERYDLADQLIDKALEFSGLTTLRCTAFARSHLLHDKSFS